MLASTRDDNLPIYDVAQLDESLTLRDGLLALAKQKASSGLSAGVFITTEGKASHVLTATDVGPNFLTGVPQVCRRPLEQVGNKLESWESLDSTLDQLVGRFIKDQSLTLFLRHPETHEPQGAVHLRDVLRHYAATIDESVTLDRHFNAWQMSVIGLNIGDHYELSSTANWPYIVREMACADTRLIVEVNNKEPLPQGLKVKTYATRTGLVLAWGLLDLEIVDDKLEPLRQPLITPVHIPRNTSMSEAMRIMADTPTMWPLVTNKDGGVIGYLNGFYLAMEAKRMLKAT